MSQTLRDYQLQAVENLRGHLLAGKRRVLLVSPTGCHAPGQPILMFDGGIKPVEQIRVGDQVMGPDSTPRTVLQLRHGFDEMFRITPVKGDPFVVNRHHVLTLVRTGDKERPGGEIVDVELDKYFNWSAYAKHVHKLFRARVDFPAPAEVLSLDPYFLGVWLGDGTTSSIVAISKPDPEIRALAEEQAHKYGLQVRAAAGDTTSVSWVISGFSRRRNPMRDALEKLGLGRMGPDRFIPQQYKLGPPAARRAILAGLIDSDGHVNNGGCDFISMYRTLTDDLVFVARSLGLAAYAHPCEKRDQNGGGGTYYRAYISGDLSVLPMRIARKKAAPRAQKKNVLRTGFSVEPVDPGSFYGFTLDHDGRYLLGDFTVTHNSGKTTIAADGMIAPAVTRGGSVLFLAHRRELIDQCSKRLTGAGVEHGVIMAGVAPLPWLPVQVASIPTLTARLAQGDALPGANLIILDEAHHARAQTYDRILNAYPNSAIIGLSATPWRTDGRGLGELFEELVVAARPAELIARGYLAPYTGLAYDTPDIKLVQRKGSDYDQAGLELVVSERAIVGNVVQQYQEHAAGLRAIVFAVSVKHSKDLVSRFQAAGVACEHVDGEMPTGQRDAILKRLNTGATKVICNVGVLTEGFDCPTIECIILARPTLSCGLYLQMVGRGMRPACLSCGQYAHPAAIDCEHCGSQSIKRVCRIHDHGGCIMEHGMPDADREYRLDADSKQKDEAQKLMPLRTCKACFAIFSALSGSDACPQCGHVNPPMVRELREIDNDSVRAVPLSELPKFKHASEDTRKEHYARLLRVAVEKGHRKGAAAMKFRAIYGVWPSPGWRLDLELQASVTSAARSA